MKKILCILLSLLTVMGAFAFAVFAEESTDPADSEDISYESSEPSDPTPGESSEDSSDSSTGESGDSSAPAVREYDITFSVDGGAAGVVCDGYTPEVDGSDYIFSIPNGESVVFTVTALDDGYAVTGISSGSYEVDLAAGTVSLTVNRKHVNITVTVAPADSVKVSLGECENGTVSYEGSDDPNKRFVIGSKLALNLKPDDGFGVATVSVNGKKVVDKLPVGSGTFEVEVAPSEEGSDLMEIEVAFGRLVTIYVVSANGEFIVPGFEPRIDGNVGADNYTFEVPAGRTINFTVTPDTGKKIKSVTIDRTGNSISVTNNSFSVTVNSDWTDTIRIEYADLGETSSHTVTVKIEGGEHGAVYYGNDEVGKDIDGKIKDVEHGKKLSFTAEAEEGYTVSVTVDGDECSVKSNGSFKTGAVEDDMLIVVSFVEEDEESSEETSDEDGNGNTGFTYLVKDDVTVFDSMAKVTVDITEKTKLGRDLLVKLNDYLKEESHMVEIKAEDYTWIILGGSYFNTTALDQSGIDFGLTIEGQASNNEVIAGLTEHANKNNLSDTVVIVVKRNDSAALPDGTQLVLDIGNYSSNVSAGTGFQWLRYNADATSNRLSNTSSVIYEVDSDGIITITEYANVEYGVLCMYVGETSRITVEYDRTQCIMGYLDKVTTDSDGVVTNIIAWANGEDFSLYITPKDGYVFDSVTLSESGQKLQIFDSTNTEISDGGVKGKSGRIKVVINGLSQNGKITVKMSATNQASAGTSAKSESSTPWEVIILIVVIGITMIGGGVFFVIKWRQSGDDDDDDDEFEDFDGDDEDDE